MAVRLRTRLFLVVGALVAASILTSAVLSRQLTLVEVREFVVADPGTGGARDVLDAAVAAAATGRPADVSADLAQLERDTGRRLVLFDAEGQIVAASNPSLAGARVLELTPEGTFVGSVSADGVDATIAIRGAPTRLVTTSDGGQLWVLLLPPSSRDPIAVGGRTGVPGWISTTLATVIVAIPLVFAVSRRILGPVTALTDAARRMRGGDLAVSVAVRGRDELADLGHAFNDMAARLAEQERLRKQMVGDVAHELRSPVTNLRCTLEAIQDGLTPLDRASLDLLHDETLFLQRLIADLEELASADAGQLTLHRSRLDLTSLLRRVIGSLQATPGARISLDAPAVALGVDGDPDRIEQVFRNLLVNARTHTPSDGRITVRLSDESGRVRVDVQDTGAGIEAAHLPHVFARFYRADRSRTRTTGGAGLGLAIARQLAVAHGGEITVDSDGPGRGATFTVRLPRSA